MKSSPTNRDLTSSPSFEIKGLHENLGAKATSGGAITALAQAFRFAIYMGSTIVLARLLTKEDFGLVAMVAALMSLLRMFREAGLSTATLQREHITHAQVSNLFWINLGLGCTAALVGIAAAPLVAWFFHDSRLVGITIGLTMTFFFNGSSVQHLALLNRQLRFKSLALVDICSTVAGGFVGITMAATNFGYWSLVGSQISTSLVEMVMAWTLSQWRPQLPRRNAETRSLVRFGASLTFSTLLRRLTGGSDSILIGRFCGAEELGLYSRGTALLMRPLDQLILPFDIVFLPILSRLITKPDRYRQTYLKVFRAIAIASFPIAGLLFALSTPLVSLMLGDKWLQVAPIFCALSVIALFYPLVCSTFWLTTTQQRNRDIVLLGIINSVIPLLAYSSGLPFGVTGVAWAASLAGLLVRVPIQFYIVGRTGPVTTQDLWRCFSSHLPLWIIAVAIAEIARLLLLQESPIMQISIAGAAATLAVGAAILIVPSWRLTATEMLERGLQLLGERFRTRQLSPSKVEPSR